MSQDLRRDIYATIIAINESFKSTFPNYESFQKVLDGDNGRELLSDVYATIADDKEIGAGFVSAFPDLENLTTRSGVGKYTSGEKEQLREGALSGIQNLYKGDFDKLLKYHDQIPDKIAKLQYRLARALKGDTSFGSSGAINRSINNLKKAQELVEAYQGVSTASSDIEFDDLLSGKVQAGKFRRPEGWTEEDEKQHQGLAPSVREMSRPVGGIVPNRYLSRIMPDVNYKVMELQGGSPSPMEGLFPEATRRADAGQDMFDVGVGGFKDIVRAGGRATRPLVSMASGAGSPVLSYWEQFAKPDKYKSPTEEFYDEAFLSPNLLGGVLTGGAKVAGKMVPKLASSVNKVLPFRATPDQIIQGRLSGASEMTPFTADLTYSMLRNAPEVGMDVAYEATRGADEEGTPMGALIGGGAGMLGVPILSRGKDLALDKFTKSNFRKDLQSGYKDALAGRLAPEKKILNDRDMTSLGGLDQLTDTKEALAKIKQEIGTSREGASEVFDAMMADEYKALASDPRLLKDIYTNRDITPLGTEQFKAYRDIEDRYLEEISKRYRGDQDKILAELEEYTGVTLPKENDLIERIKTFQKINPTKITTAEMDDTIKRIKEREGIGNKYQIAKEFEGNYPNAKKVVKGIQKPPSVVEEIKGRTKLREHGRDKATLDQKEGGQKSAFEMAEDAQRKVMNETLDKSFLGRKIKDDYERFAKVHGLEKQLPDLKDLTQDLKKSTAVDSWLNKIGLSGVNPTEKANALNYFINLTKEIEEVAGKGSAEWINNAVIRKLKDPNYVGGFIGYTNNPAMAMKITKALGKLLKKGSLKSINLRQAIAQATKEAEREGTPEKLPKLSGDNRGDIDNIVDKRWRALQRQYENEGAKLPPLAP